jgi:hypothetical protein
VIPAASCKDVKFIYSQLDAPQLQQELEQIPWSLPDNKSRSESHSD